MKKNLAWRQEIVTEADADKALAADLWKMCRDDALFFANGFCFLLEPRTGEVLPFITYPHQDPAILTLDECVASPRDDHVVKEKSRCQGATWMGMFTFTRRATFFENQHFKVASRKEDLVDKKGDEDTLFAKIDFLTNHLPGFLRPDITRNHLAWINTSMHSSIIGAPTTADISRGGRRKAIWIDEYAFFGVPDSHAVLGSISSASSCNIFCSTHQGTAGGFYKKATQKTGITKIQLFWWDHPVQSLGLYTFRDGKLEILDKDYPFPEDYEFIPTDEHGNPLNGKYRSPYYDLKCEEMNHIPALVAQELDCDPEGSGNQFFSQPVIEKHRERHVRPAVLHGDLDYATDTAEPEGFLEDEGGRMLLWEDVRKDDVREGRKFILSLDVSAGQGASNSTMVGADKDSCEKLLEYASPFIRPEELAVFAVATAKWLNDAYIIWDATGPTGKAFGKTLIELGYRNLFRRQSETRMTKKVSDEAGFIFVPGIKAQVFGAYQRALQKDTYINRSGRALDEALQFVWTTATTIEHSSAQATLDPSGAKQNHGDICTADVLLVRAMKERPKRKPEDPPLVINPNSLASRMQEWRDRTRKRRHSGWSVGRRV